MVEWIRQQSSKLFYVGSSPAGSTNNACMAEGFMLQTLNLAIKVRVLVQVLELICLCS